MSLHVFVGADDFLVEESARRIIGDGEGLEIVDSSGSGNEDSRLADIRRVEESVLTPPFLEPRKVTWWKRVGFLPGGGRKGDEDKVSEAVKLALDGFAKRMSSISLPDNQQFVITASHLLKSSIFAKTLMTCGEVVFMGGDPRDESRMVGERVRERAEELGLKFAAGALPRFVSFVGSDTRSLYNELEKLRDYLGKERNEITVADIEDVTSIGVGNEPMPWDVTNAIGERDAAKALAALRRFELVNGFEVFMSTVIEKFFRQLYDLKSATARGEKPSADGMTPGAFRKNMSYIRNWSLAELRAARCRFLTLRERTVAGTNAGPVLVVTELMRAMRRSQERR